MASTILSAGYTLRTIPNSIGAAVGSGTHAVMAFDLEHVMNTGDLPNWGEAEDRGVEELKSRIEDEGVYWDDVTPNLSSAQKQVARLGKTYRYEVADAVVPVAVEKRRKLRHNDLILSGQTDLVVTAPDALRDLKTGKARAGNYAQYGCYSLLLRTHGLPIAVIIEDYLQRVPLDHEQPPVQQNRYDVQDCEILALHVLARIREDIDRFRQSGGEANIVLANPNSYLCGEKFCPAHGTNFCAYGKAK